MPPPPSPEKPPLRRPAVDLLWLVALGFLGLLAYWPALHGALLWDDPAHVTRLGLQSLAGLRRIWFEAGATQEYYPILHSAFWLEHRLWGEAPLPYHVLNVALHAGSGWLLALFLRRLWTQPDGTRVVPAGAEWLAAALFVVHPVCVESVAWITEQKNTLSTFFYLLAGLAYWDFSVRRSRGAYALALALFAVALGAKTATVTLPAALLVLLWWKNGRLDWRRDVVPLLPWFALAVAAGVVTTRIEGDIVGAELVVPDLTLGQRVLLAGRIFWFYLGKALWPANLTFFYPLWDVAAESGRWLPALAAGLAATAALWAWCRRARGPLAAWLLYGGTLFPVLGFFKVYAFSFAYVADHLQYLALPVVATVAAAGLCWLGARVPRAVLPLVATGLVLALAGLSWRHARFYTDDETLFRANIRANPQSWMGHRVLAYSVGLDPARRDEAIALYREALRLKTDNPDSAAALAGLLVRQPGHRDEAIALFREAVRLRPTFAEAYNGLGNELAATPGGIPEAIAQYETALRLRPRFGLARANLARALARVPGRETEALACFDTVLAEMPDHAPAHYHLANLLAQLGRLPEALPHYERALELAPGAAEIHYDLARQLAARPEFQTQTLAHVEAAVQLDPGFVEAWNLLGVVHARVGEVEAARAAWERALALRPDFAPARRNLSALDRTPGR